MFTLYSRFYKENAMKRFFISFSILVLASLACQTLTSPGGNNVTPTSIVDFSTITPDVPTIVPTTPTTTAPQANVLFEDDFSNPASNWSTGEDGEAKLAIEDGTFHIQIKVPQNLYWTTAGENLTDVHIDVDSEKLAGPDPAEYGVVCRYNEANGIYNFYYLVIAGDSYAAIVKIVNGEQQEISARDLKFDAIQSGNASNHITAECVANRLSLSANGKELLSVTDDTHTSGDVGLIATTYEEGGVDIKFDNFVVTTP